MDKLTVIKAACTNVADWQAKTSSELAEAIASPYRLEPMTTTQLFALAIQAGAVCSELSQLYKFDSFMSSLERALTEGAYSDVKMLLEMASELTPFSAATISGLDAVLASRALRMVDVFCEPGQNPPASVSASDVEAALAQ